jgi:hypothetical protein
VNLSAVETTVVPPAATTATFTFPAPGGLTAEIVVVGLAVKLSAATEPNRTAEGVVRWVPLMVTVVPPASGPDDGVIEMMVGAVTYLYLAADDAVPPVVVTLMVTVPPGVWRGAVTLIWVDPGVVTAPGVDPNVTVAVVR